MAGASFLVALFLRLFGTDYDIDDRTVIAGVAAMAIIGAGVFRLSGLYRGVWRYASINDLYAIARAVTLTVLIFTFFMFVWARLDEVPRSLPFINWLVLMAMLGGPRFIYRLAKDRRLDLQDSLVSHQRVPILLAGAGDEAELFIRSLRQDPQPLYRVVGIVSESQERVGRTIHNISVMGDFTGIEQVIQKLDDQGNRPQRLVITKPRMDGAVVRRLLDIATQNGMALARMPKLTDFRAAEGEVIATRPVDISDLLGRPQTPLDREAMAKLVRDRRVVVTGAGGSIGSELVRQITGFQPSRLVLIDSNEFALYQINQEVVEISDDLDRDAVIADVRNRDRIMSLIADEHPDIVFHAAALKHVPLVESNPSEGILTNVIGTRNVVDACIQSNVAVMVQISTDKAVNPSSIMGASKRLAEMYCQAVDLDKSQSVNTRFVTVRFGNVLGSTGSVVPLFQRQLAAGGPLTVTHPDMTRYFMTVREAVELVLMATAKGSSEMSTDGRIFVLDMGEPVRILDLAKQMIRLAGLEPDIDIPISFTGTRPGEKLFEEIFHGAEAPVPTNYSGLLLAAPRSADASKLADAITKIENAAISNDDHEVIRQLHLLIPEFINDADEIADNAAKA
jgi:FlaA1/EpsC-like NDP-sugar epimerase